jgi:hypothetical protein
MRDRADGCRGSTADVRVPKSDPRSAGTSAWAQARALAGPRSRIERTKARRYRTRRVFNAVVTIVIAAGAATTSTQLSAASPTAAGVGLLVCAGVVVVGIRRVLADSRLVNQATSAARRLASVARSAFADVDEAAAGAFLASDNGHGDVGYWMALALTRRRTAAALVQLSGRQCWWHDVQLHADPAITFDHVGVGDSGVVIVQDLLMSTQARLTVDGVQGLSYAGYPIGGSGAAPFMSWQMRAASTVARAAGVPLSTVTSIALVANAELIDEWGARTEIEQFRHTEGLVGLTYGTAPQLAAALVTDCHLDADVVALALQELAEAIEPNVDNILSHQSAGRARSVRRRDRWSYLEARHG